MFTNSLSASRSQKRRSLLPLLLGLALVACGARAATPPASTRAPAAQEQVARAELTLENDDLHDVMYRPGEQKISIKLSPRAVASMRDAFAGRYPVHVHIRHTDTNLLLRTPPTTDVMQITARSPEELALLFKEITGVDAP